MAAVVFSHKPPSPSVDSKRSLVPPLCSQVLSATLACFSSLFWGINAKWWSDKTLSIKMCFMTTWDSWPGSECENIWGSGAEVSSRDCTADLTRLWMGLTLGFTLFLENALWSRVPSESMLSLWMRTAYLSSLYIGVQKTAVFRGRNLGFLEMYKYAAETLLFTSAFSNIITRLGYMLCMRLARYWFLKHPAQKKNSQHCRALIS